ncbi:glycoside hydrolase family 3 protein [Bacteroides sp. 214]|uniref:xylan 1,4-beta-xylosidase n=1 Tax=Bacteroides sp. 214 TaxID=2302935 RepID=UPI0013D07ABE|nr:xylan 1,4-beta-xylosidase [Bacteroides sp. 214]NDW12689.1 glycoside hydrolase family 3 protein [Bacteroides sp. 214]
MKHTLLLLVALLISLGACTDKSYRNTSLPAEQRAEDLLRQLTLDEKIALMMDASAPVERLGIKQYNWWNEALHGVARAGLATVFPQPIGMAASFDPQATYHVFDAISDEARAKNTYTSSINSYKRYQGLTMWTPNINIFRDPRWGRGMETYGEDPYLTTVMGIQVVNGLQGPAGSKYDKLHACAKHFAVHSGPEWNRHSYNAENISPRDLHETYLPAFEALVKEAGVKEVMCAYNRLEGDPCCGSDRLLVQILRNEWNFEGIVLSDCGAIDNFFKPKRHETHPDGATAVAAAVVAGTDLECGNSYKYLKEAIEKGLITEADLDISVKRLLKARFELGEMDDPKEVVWTQIPYSAVGSAKHDSLALDIAHKSIVLLENHDNTLPLKRGGLTIAVMGPNANDSVMQWGNYNGNPPQTVTILEGVRRALGANDKLIYEPGCSWIETTIKKSIYNQSATEAGIGFRATYWNNMKREGAPIATTQMKNPFWLHTAGATVFEAGVNLTDFSATYSSTFIPQQTGDVIFDFNSCGTGRLYINGEEIKKYSHKYDPRETSYTLAAKAGKAYDVRIEFEYLNSDAQLHFDIVVKEPSNVNKSLGRIKAADIVVFAGGISPSLEGEEMNVDYPGFRKGDRTDIKLPAIQNTFLQALLKANKKVVYINCSGSAIEIPQAIRNQGAVLQAWYPGQAGGTAVADILFGEYNPAGRLPITFYKDVDKIPDFEDYNMTNRTYRYAKSDNILYPFGYGLSYTTFSYGELALSKNCIKAGETVTLTIPVSNIGAYSGDEIVQVYIRKQEDIMGPTKALRAFERIKIEKGMQTTVAFELTNKQLEWWDDNTNTMRVVPGIYEIKVGRSSEDIVKMAELVIE